MFEVIYVPKKSQHNVEHRRRLYLNNPYCFWCWKRTKWERPANGILNPWSATIDHISEHQGVLACHQCNNERSRIQSDIANKRHLEKDKK